MQSYPRESLGASSRNVNATIDPLQRDDQLDSLVVLSDRQLARIVLVAVECGARFQRDGLHQDPLAWMFAPRKLFGGARPVDAVIDLADCERAIILHGLGLLDCHTDFIDQFGVH